MRRPTLYLETSIFGFCLEEDPIHREKRDATRTLLDQVRRGIFRGLVSQYVVAELERGPAGLLALLRDHSIPVIAISDAEAEELAREYTREGVLPERLLGDAFHVAAATLLEVDVLVTLNLRHIANAWRVRKFNSVNLRKGYRSIEVSTPMQVTHETK